MGIINKIVHVNKMTFLFILFPILVITSCKKLIEIAPPDEIISTNNVFANDETTIAVLTGIYANMSQVTEINQGGFVGSNGISVMAGLSSDELALYSGVTSAKHVAYYRNALTGITPAYGVEHWTPLYNYIFRCNAAIEGLMRPEANVLTANIRRQLLGEGKFLRAFFYFYLVNLFGDVPLIVTTDYKVNTLLGRSSKMEIYKQIIADLKDAKELLSANYLDASLLRSTGERVRPTQWAATALLARVYLYESNYTKAEEEATAIINNNSLFGLPALNAVFIKNSMEAIWQVQPTTTTYNTEDARTFIIPSTGPSNGTNVTNPVFLSTELLSAFEAGDKRRVGKNWIDSVIVNGLTFYFPFKYKINLPNVDITAATGTQNMKEYHMVLRLAEQYLIRAEARAQQDNLEGGNADLNAIRKRAGLSEIYANDKSDLLAAILQERFVELFSEWGHRWFDLKRTENVNTVMTETTPLKSLGLTSWQSYQQLYPIPQLDIDRAPNLVQTPGY